MIRSRGFGFVYVNQTKRLNYFPCGFMSHIIPYYRFIDALPHLSCCPPRRHRRFLISSITWLNHMKHHISQRLKSSFTSLKMNTGTMNITNINYDAPIPFDKLKRQLKLCHVLDPPTNIVSAESCPTLSACA